MTKALQSKRCLVAGLCVTTTIAVAATFVTYTRCDHYGCVPNWLYNRRRCFEPTAPAGTTRFFYLLLREFHQHFRRHNITYIPMAGTLLGLYRHGGKIPWDDDADFMMPYSAQGRLVASLNDTGRLAMGGYLPFDRSDPNFRIFSHQWNFADPATSRYGWRLVDYTKGTFPYIDVFMYDENATHVWAISYVGEDPAYAFAKAEVFPLVPTRFDELTLMAPERTKMTRLLRKMRLNWTQCENSPHYKVSPIRKLFCHNLLIPCSRLAQQYKFLPGTID